MATAEIRTTRDLFLWCMSVIYLFAFASLFVQIPDVSAFMLTFQYQWEVNPYLTFSEFAGLYGENGILPAKLVLEKEAESFVDLLSKQPTLLRLLPKVGLDLDTGMDFLCIGGAMLAFVAMVSRDQRNCIVFSVLWMFYLSLFQVGQTFLWFQWDILLLEAGFLCIIISPLNFFGYLDVMWQLPHDAITFWLVKWLLFRRTFASGLSKLSGEESSWWTLTEMNHYYETQNLPTPLAWYFHNLPEWLQRLSVVSLLSIQIPISLLFFSPYCNQRRFAFYCQCVLCCVMMLSGNYGFYTLLILTLSLSLVDDHWLQSWTKHRIGDSKPLPSPDSNKGPVQKWLFCGLTYGILALAIKKLFAIEFSLFPLQIKSNSVFTEKDLDYFMYWLTPVTIIIATCSLFNQIKKSVLSCRIDKKKGVAQGCVYVAGCLVFGMIAVAIFTISLVPHTSINTEAKAHLPDQLKEIHSTTVTNYRLSSPYMFYSRTYEEDEKGRLEVVIEGSETNEDWKEYNFRFKPGNTSSQLPIVSPHQPRLDWQMWFAARDGYENNHWLLNLVYRLLTNQDEVLELMGENPFPDDPPKYIRCTLYRYHFASSDKADDRYSASNWWVREPVGEYLPILSLDEPTFSEYITEAGLTPAKTTARKRKQSGNLLRGTMERIRSLLGQGNGSSVCLILVVMGFLLTLLDPSISIIASVAVEPVSNGHPMYPDYRRHNDIKSN